MDVIAQKGTQIDIFEIKHRTLPYQEEYQHAKNVLEAAEKQLKGYYDILLCEVLDGHTLSISVLDGETRYKLFSLDNLTTYIHLRHRGEGVIEYWTSTENRETKRETQVYPDQLVNKYKEYRVAKKIQEDAYRGIVTATATVAGVAAATTLVVTAGLVVGNAVVGIKIPSITPEIASWMATAVSNIVVKTAEATPKIVYQAGRAIQTVYENAPIAIFKKANNKQKRQTNAGNPAAKQNRVPCEPRQGAGPDFGLSIHEGGPSSWTTSSQWDSDRDCRAEGIVPSFPFPPGPPGQPLHGESAYCPSQQCLRA